jgi:hypothetical protein
MVMRKGRVTVDHSLRRGDPGFYVYLLLVQGEPRYIGKGCGDRPKEHVRTARRINRLREGGRAVRTSRLYNRLAAALAAGLSVEVEVLSRWDSEAEALEAERAAIAAAPDGQLWNVFPGGEGMPSEFAKELWRSPDYRARMSEMSRRNWESAEYRANQLEIRRSPEHRAKASETLRAALADPRVRQKMSDRKREALKDLKVRQRMAQNAAAGRTPEKRQRDSERLKALWADPEWRAARLAAQQEGKMRPEVRKARSDRAKAQAARRKAKACCAS